MPWGHGITGLRRVPMPVQALPAATHVRKQDQKRCSDEYQTPWPAKAEDRDAHSARVPALAAMVSPGNGPDRTAARAAA
jgi:hypothetical protein